MAVKKATSATKKGLPTQKAASARTASTKTSAQGARAAEMTATEAAAKNRTAAKTAAKPAVRKPAAKEPAQPGTAAKGSGSPKAAVRASARPQRLRVRENETPWTTRELATVRADLEAEIERLQREISVAELDLVDLMRDAGEGSGDDQADAGTATFEREQEISLANNARGVFEQSARALARLLDGSYGVCESCGSPIGKNRLLAFPRATLCMTCKSKQERR